MIYIKIGEFSKKYNLTKESTRYYTDEKLLLPHKVRHYNDYDLQCEKDIQNIIKLKGMGFTLAEIREIMNYLRLEAEVFPNLNEFLLVFFECKLNRVNEEKEVLIKREQTLIDKIKSLKDMSSSISVENHINSGVDLQFLSLLSCKKCNNSLNLKMAEIRDGEIIEGMLKCECGVEYEIHDGILFCEGADDTKKVPAVNTKEDIEERYPSEYTSIKSIAENWLKGKIRTDLKGNEALLDFTTMGGVYLLPILEKAKRENLLYVGCERWLSFLKVSKKTVDSIKNKPKTLFCCGDIRHAPFKASAFEIIIDVYGTMTDMRETGDFKLNQKINLLKDRGRFYGIYYNISNLSNENPENLRKSLNFAMIEKELMALDKKNCFVSPKTKEFGEFNTLLKKNDREELTVCAWIGEKTEGTKSQRN